MFTKTCKTLYSQNWYPLWNLLSQRDFHDTNKTYREYVEDQRKLQKQFHKLILGICGYGFARVERAKERWQGLITSDDVAADEAIAKRRLNYRQKYNNDIPITTALYLLLNPRGNGRHDVEYNVKSCIAGIDLLIDLGSDINTMVDVDFCSAWVDNEFGPISLIMDEEWTPLCTKMKLRGEWDDYRWKVNWKVRGNIRK